MPLMHTLISINEHSSTNRQLRNEELGKLARKRFEAMLRGLSGKCGEMARCMAFSLEHAEAAHEVMASSPNIEASV